MMVLYIKRRVRGFLDKKIFSTFSANNAMQGPHGPCPYGTGTDLASGAAVAPHEFTAGVSCGSNY